MIPRELLRLCALLCITLWVGGMWMLGYGIVPLLFSLLPERQLAGNVAGVMFSALAWIGIICAMYLLGYLLQLQGRAALRHAPMRITLLMLACVLAGQFVLQPRLAALKQQALPLDVMHSTFAGQFTTWHAVSGVVFLIQSLLGIALVAVSRKF